MKAMILTAGLGTRLRPLTLERAKPAIPVCGQPLIIRIVEHLKAHGITSFRLNLCWMPDTIRDVFANNEDEALDVSFSYESEILGTGGGLKANQDFFENETFLMVNGDILCDVPITPVVDFHRNQQALATLVLFPQRPPFRYTPIKIDGNSNISDFRHDPSNIDETTETFVFSGIHVIEPEIFEYIEPGIFQEIISHAYGRALSDGRRILGYPASGYWNDLGSPASYLQAVDAVLAGKPDLAPSGSFRANHARIHSNAFIRNSSIETGAVVEENCRVVNSIMWEDSRLSANAEIFNCIVGRGVSVSGSHENEVITVNGFRSIESE